MHMIRHDNVLLQWDVRKVISCCYHEKPRTKARSYRRYLKLSSKNSISPIILYNFTILILNPRITICNTHHKKTVDQPSSTTPPLKSSYEKNTKVSLVSYSTSPVIVCWSHICHVSWNASCSIWGFDIKKSYRYNVKWLNSCLEWNLDARWTIYSNRSDSAYMMEIIRANNSAFSIGHNAKSAWAMLSLHHETWS